MVPGSAAGAGKGARFPAGASRGGGRSLESHGHLLLARIQGPRVSAPVGLAGLGDLPAGPDPAACLLPAAGPLRPLMSPLPPPPPPSPAHRSLGTKSGPPAGLSHGAGPTSQEGRARCPRSRRPSRPGQRTADSCCPGLAATPRPVTTDSPVPWGVVGKRNPSGFRPHHRPQGPSSCGHLGPHGRRSRHAPWPELLEDSFRSRLRLPPRGP